MQYPSPLVVLVDGLLASLANPLVPVWVVLLPFDPDLLARLNPLTQTVDSIMMSS